MEGRIFPLQPPHGSSYPDLELPEEDLALLKQDLPFLTPPSTTRTHDILSMESHIFPIQPPKGAYPEHYLPEPYLALLKRDPPYSTLYKDAISMEDRTFPIQPPHGPSYLNLNLPETYLTQLDRDPPSLDPPYSPLYKDVMLQNYLFLREADVRENALFPVRLHAGQVQVPPNGGLGMHMTPPPPEVLGGSIYSCSI